MNRFFSTYGSRLTVILTAIFFMATLGIPISAKTQFIQETRNPGVTFLQGELSTCASQFNPTTTRSYSEESNEDDHSMHTCTLNIDYDTNLYDLKNAYAVDPKNNYYVYQDKNTNRFLIDVPQGIYDFCFVWKSLSDAAYNIVIKEAIPVMSDISLDVNASEATECIHFSVMKMDGQKLDAYTVDYDSEGQLRVLEKGNSDTPMLNLMTSLYDREYQYPILTTAYFGYGNVLANDYSGAVSVESYRIIHINPEIYKYTVNHQEVFYDGGYVNGVCFEWQNGDATELTNDPDSFIFNEMEFADTPLHYESTVAPDSGMYPEYVFNFMSKVMGGGLYMESDEDRVCRQAVSLTNTYLSDNYFLSLWRTDHARKEEDLVNIYDVRSCSIGFDAEGFTYNSLVGSSYGISSDGSEKSLFDNPFAFPYKDSPIVLGDNTPFMKFAAFNGNSMAVASNGQEGEYRISDMLSTSAVLKNGTEIVEEFYPTPSVFTIPQETSSNQWTIETLNTNVRTMDIAGSNVSVLKFRTIDNVIQPIMVIQAIQMRDDDDNVTVYFTNTEDAKVCIAGGQFSHHNNQPHSTWYSCAEEVPEVEIWVSPHGEKEWHPLEVINYPDKFYMPGLGHYFEASLDGTQDYCDLDGWCDLKVSMNNEYGDCNTQILSPGFHIGDLSAVTEVCDERAFTVFDGCINVPVGGRIFGIDGREYTSSLLPAGYYVILHNSKAYKIIIP